MPNQIFYPKILVPFYPKDDIYIPSPRHAIIEQNLATVGSGGTTLIDSTTNFLTGGVQIGDTVMNSNPADAANYGNTTTVAAIVSATELTLTVDIGIATGRKYSVYANKPDVALIYLFFAIAPGDTMRVVDSRGVTSQVLLTGYAPTNIGQFPIQVSKVLATGTTLTNGGGTSIPLFAGYN